MWAVGFGNRGSHTLTPWLESPFEGTEGTIMAEVVALGLAMSLHLSKKLCVLGH